MARKMRDSGVEWIGEVPEGWEVSRVKNECINLDSLREPISAENRENKQCLYDYYGASGVIDKIDNYNVDDTVLLIGEDGANLRMRNLPLVYKATGKFWVNNHAHILKPKEGRDYGFMAYALEAGDYNDFITGSAQPKLSQANLMAYPIALPPLPEQRAIADYLDEKCEAIDGAVGELKRGIEDCKAWKKAIIFEAVTGKRRVGFNAEKQRGRVAERPMRDSGIPWIGEIPDGWEVVKARRFIASTQNGLTRRNLSESKGEIVLRLKNVSSDGYIDYSDVVRIELSENEKSSYGLITGDLLFARVNGSRSLVGKCAEYVGNREFVAYNDHLIRVRVNDMIARRFFTYYLFGQAGKTEIELHTSTSAGQFTISGAGLRDIAVVMPPLPEQQAIADYLDEKCAAIDALVVEKEKLIADLEAYKKSLIFELVTGKREVA